MFNNSPKPRRFFTISLILFICSLILYSALSINAFPDYLMVSAENAETLYASGLLDGEFAVTAAAPGDERVGNNINIDTYEETAADMTLSLFGLPIKNVSVEVLANVEVVPCGMTVGINIDTTGLIVLGTGSVTAKDGTTSRPCEGKIKSGDILLKADGREITSHKQLIIYLDSLKPGAAVSLTFSRGGQVMEVSISCAVNEEGKNKLGLWVRDSTKGIGTVTYYNPVSSRFAALGHGVVDVDTKQLIPVRTGRLYEVEIVSVKKGKKGSPGELVGDVNNTSSLGVITDNLSLGLYGTVNAANAKFPTRTMKIALQSEIHEGPAVILSNVSGREIKQYDVYIERVNRYSADDSKGMVIRITDQELVTRTGGIVQGMSGCPIIQDGKLIGAVTHVFVQNPLKGYGIFIENMIKYERKL